MQRIETKVIAKPPDGGEALVSVSLFQLRRPYRPYLFRRVVPELDRAARLIAKQLEGQIERSETLELAGRRARRYEIRFEADGKQLVERIGFVLKGFTEYQLLCRFERGDEDGEAACRHLYRFALS